jgi:MoxR-like ATPase
MIEAQAAKVQSLLDECGRVIVGQHAMLRSLVLGLLAGGHVLLEGLPGLAKTLAISSLARSLSAPFSRIQFTPDLLPADLVGTLVFEPKTGEFTPRKGPIFANLVLADEINRAPAKVQSALLQAMQERSVTIGSTTYGLEEPFLVLATQNPIEQEGTYPLPEAQVDRFLFKVRVGYPTPEEEREIVTRAVDGVTLESVRAVMTPGEVLDARRATRSISVDPRIRDYAVSLVRGTRDPASVGIDAARLIDFGASPRASIGLVQAARANALVDGRPFVTPSDIKVVALDVLRHRVMVTYEAEAEGIDSDAVVGMILDRVPAP